MRKEGRFAYSNTERIAMLSEIGGMVPQYTWGNADDYQNKGVGEKAIRKTMKTKVRKNRVTLWLAYRKQL
jgi:hypothetical protein